jgi:chromosome segregation ATPase
MGDIYPLHDSNGRSKTQKWRGKGSVHRASNTPSSLERARRMRSYGSNSKYAMNGVASSGTRTSSTGFSHGEALLLNLDSALRALESTPKSRFSDSFRPTVDESIDVSPIPVMKSLDDDGEGQYSTPVRQRESWSASPSPLHPLELVESRDSPADRMMRLQQNHSALVNDCAQLEAHVLKAEQKRDMLHKKIMGLDADINQLKNQKSDMENSIESMRREYETKIADMRSLDELFTEREGQLAEVEGQIKVATRDLELLNIRIQDSKLDQEKMNKCLDETNVSLSKKKAELASLRDEHEAMQSSCNTLQYDVTTMTSRKEELQRDIQHMKDEIQESEETMRRIQSLTSEGCILVEDQSRKAAIAQEKWEFAEQRLAEIECQLLETSSRLQAKKDMIREFDQKHAPCSVENEDPEIKNRIALLQQLDDTTKTKLEERMALEREILSLKSSKNTEKEQMSSSGACLELEQLSERNQSLEHSLNQALAEVDRLTHRHESIRTCQALQMKLSDTENRLECALKEVEYYEHAIAAGQTRVEKAEMAYHKVKSELTHAQEDLEQKDAIIKELQSSSSRVENEVQALERKQETARQYATEKDQIIRQLRREKHEAMERIQELHETVGRLKSSVRNRAILPRVYAIKGNCISPKSTMAQIRADDEEIRAVHLPRA